jgi:hypothetical protein
VSSYEKSYLVLVHRLLGEREQQVASEHAELISETNVALSLLFGLPHISRGVHQDNRLGVTCVMHVTKSANDYLAALDLISESLHAQAANAARAGFETACQCAWLHLKRNRLDAWWDGASAAHTRQIRADLPRADFRHFIYAELCEVAHPRRRSMEFLVSRRADEQPAVSLVPPYDSVAIHHTLRALYICIVCSLWDFELLHEPAMSPDQQEAWRSFLSRFVSTMRHRSFHTSDQTNGVTRRCSETLTAPISRCVLAKSSNLQRYALSPAVNDLVSP